MEKIFFGIAFLLSQFAFSQPDQTAAKYAQLITPADLKDNLSIIASDALEGRYTGSRGQKMAAAFIDNYFETVGLAGPVNGSHYMPLELTSTRPGDIYMKVGTSRYTNFNEIVYTDEAISSGEISLEAVYVGKGTDADYAYLNVKDKAAVVFIDSLSFNMISVASNHFMKAIENGARMMLIVAGGKEEKFRFFALQLKELMSGGLLSLEKVQLRNSDNGSFFINQTVASKIFNMPFEKILKATLEDASKKALAKIKPSRIVYQASMETKTMKSENVLGYLEGTDKKDEVIVISAHYDHIGLHDGEDKVNNGADDDGSGTVTVLQLAKAFAQAKKEGHGPRRSILFMTVTGEEEGLFGSEYYVTHPVFPLANTIAGLAAKMHSTTESRIMFT